MFIAVIMGSAYLAQRIHEKKRRKIFFELGQAMGFSKRNQETTFAKSFIEGNQFYSTLSAIQFFNILYKEYENGQDEMIADCIYSTHYSRNFRPTRTVFYRGGLQLGMPDFSVAPQQGMEKLNKSYFTKEGYQSSPEIPNGYVIKLLGDQPFDRDQMAVVRQYLETNPGHYLELNKGRLIVYENTKRIEVKTLETSYKRFETFVNNLSAKHA